MLVLVAGCASRPVLVASADPTSEPGLACVDAWPEVRGNGPYDHVVHLRSRCRVVATCDVTTDVSPDVVEADVAPGEHVEVVTARGSPDTRFTPAIACRPAAR